MPAPTNQVLNTVSNKHHHQKTPFSNEKGVFLY